MCFICNVQILLIFFTSVGEQNWFVNRYAHVFVLLSIVIVTLPDSELNPRCRTQVFGDTVGVCGRSVGQEGKGELLRPPDDQLDPIATQKHGILSTSCAGRECYMWRTAATIS